MWRRIVIGVTLVAFAIGLIIAIAWIIDINHRPQMVARILKIESVPQSVRVVDCESPFTTDVLTTCALEIDPDDFPLLLKGYKFTQYQTDGTSHSLGLPKVGANFDIDIEYQVRPVEFKNGGQVAVYADKQRRHVIVDLYIE